MADYLISYLMLALKAVYLMLPAYFANMAPVFAKDFKFLEFLAKPVDLGIKMHGIRLLGSHKTFRGYVVGVAAGIIIALVQSVLSEEDLFKAISLLDYNNYNWLLIGLLMGFGALFGDTVKSFFKRRLDIKPGKPFIPFDQMDYSIGALVLLCIIYVPSIDVWLAAILVSFVLHILVNRIGFYLKLRDVKW